MPVKFILSVSRLESIVGVSAMKHQANNEIKESLVYYNTRCVRKKIV